MSNKKECGRFEKKHGRAPNSFESMMGFFGKLILAVIIIFALAVTCSVLTSTSEKQVKAPTYKTMPLDKTHRSAVKK